MSTDHVQYAFDASLWIISTTIVNWIGWYLWLRRRDRRAGAPLAPPLTVFVAIMVGLAVLASFLFEVSTRRQADKYQQCQAMVNQQFRDGYADRVKIAAEDRKALDGFIASIGDHLDSRSAIAADIAAYQQTRSSTDDKRAASPVVVTANCHR